MNFNEKLINLRKSKGLSQQPVNTKSFLVPELSMKSTKNSSKWPESTP